jgi:hypothetical protein
VFSNSGKVVYIYIEILRLGEVSSVAIYSRGILLKALANREVYLLYALRRAPNTAKYVPKGVIARYTYR